MHIRVMSVGILMSGLTILVRVRLSAMFYILTEIVTVSLKPPFVVANVMAAVCEHAKCRVRFVTNVMNYTTVKHRSSGMVMSVISMGLSATVLFRRVNTIMTANSRLHRVTGVTWGVNIPLH